MEHTPENRLSFSGSPLQEKRRHPGTDTAVFLSLHSVLAAIAEIGIPDLRRYSGFAQRQGAFKGEMHILFLPGKTVTVGSFRFPAAGIQTVRSVQKLDEGNPAETGDRQHGGTLHFDGQTAFFLFFRYCGSRLTVQSVGCPRFSGDIRDIVAV